MLRMRGLWHPQSSMSQGQLVAEVGTGTLQGENGHATRQVSLFGKVRVQPMKAPTEGAPLQCGCYIGITQDLRKKELACALDQLGAFAGGHFTARAAPLGCRSRPA